MCGTVTDQPPPAPEHVDDPWDGVDIDNAVASFFRALADGPLRDDALLAALRDDGAWGALGELADDDFAAEISDLDVPGLWRTQMAMWFDVFRTLDGRVFTHRLTADELAEGAVAALPDLTLVDWDVPARRIVGGSGAVATDFDPAFDRFDGGRLVGPDGWLDGFAPGDVLGVRLVRDDTVRVERIDAADLPGDPAVAELATAFRPASTAGATTSSPGPTCWPTSPMPSGPQRSPSASWPSPPASSAEASSSVLPTARG